MCERMSCFGIEHVANRTRSGFGELGTCVALGDMIDEHKSRLGVFNVDYSMGLCDLT
jgi:hypothetical protein